MSRFQKGQSGNPTGRPRGIPSPATKLRKAIEQDIPDIIAALVNAAKQGDTTAARILLDRVVPPLRPQGMPVTVPIGESLSETGRAIGQGGMGYRATVPAMPAPGDLVGRVPSRVRRRHLPTAPPRTAAASRGHRDCEIVWPD